MKKSIKTKLLNMIYGGKNIIYYKRSKKHPLIGKRLFSINHGFVIVEKVWNIKEYCKNTRHSYEKDDRISWKWKIQIRTDNGRYIIPLSMLLSTSTNEDGSKIDDNNLFIFYK